MGLNEPIPEAREIAVCRLAQAWLPQQTFEKGAGITLWSQAPWHGRAGDGVHLSEHMGTPGRAAECKGGSDLVRPEGCGSSRVLTWVTGGAGGVGGPRGSRQVPSPFQSSRRRWDLWAGPWRGRAAAHSRFGHGCRWCLTWASCTGSSGLWPSCPDRRSACLGVLLSGRGGLS